MVRSQAISALAFLAFLALPFGASAQPVESLVFLPRAEDGGYVDALRLEVRANGYLMSVAPQGAEVDVDARVARATDVVAELDARIAVFVSDRAIWVVSNRGTVRHAPLAESAGRVSARTFSLIVVGLIDEVERDESAPSAPDEPRSATDTPTETSGPVEPATEARVAAEPSGTDATPEPASRSAVDRVAADEPSGDAPEPAPPQADIAIHGPVTAVVVEPAMRDADEPEFDVVFGFDVVPFVGTSSMSRGRAQRTASFNLFVGFDHSLRGFELGGFANLERRDVRGGQIAGFLNGHGGDLHGVQVAGLANATMGRATGAQIASVNFARGGLLGAQIGVLNLTSGDTRGVQLGAANFAFGDTRGLQLGTLNVASGDSRAVQIGVVNVGRRTRFAFGLVNIVRDGRTQVDVLGTDTGIVYAQVKHGGEHFHSILSIGVDPFATHPAALFGFGYGVRATPARRFFVDVDFTGHFLVDSQLDAQDDLEQLVAARLLAGVRLHERFAVVFGPSYEVLLTNRPERTHGFGHFGDQELSASGTTGLRAFGWPSLVVGLEML